MRNEALCFHSDTGRDTGAIIVNFGETNFLIFGFEAVISCVFGIGDVCVG